MEYEIKLTYDSLIALIQGKKLHIVTSMEHIVLLPPTDGVFVTHDQLNQMRYQDQMGVLTFLKSLTDHTQEVKS